jgi:hypothetical protein
MSVCRFSEDCAVYMYVSDRGVECHMCELNERRSMRFGGHVDAAEHLSRHIAEGHVVAAALAWLESELAQCEELDK